MIFNNNIWITQINAEISTFHLIPTDLVRDNSITLCIILNLVQNLRAIKSICDLCLKNRINDVLLCIAEARAAPATRATARPSRPTGARPPPSTRTRSPPTTRINSRSRSTLTTMVSMGNIKHKPWPNELVTNFKLAYST